MAVDDNVDDKQNHLSPSIGIHVSSQETHQISTQLTQPTSKQNATCQALDISLPPNGGSLAWLHVLGGFMLFFNSWGILNTFGVFQTYYKSDDLFVASSSNIS
ncbi:Uu.00g101420.m01.CDS01 [Anthostomella pinea]|uniref:Uu.00g101420.m01.CDS01 n=1 Tax=Anthostomella pinea TaxID=933095 RepID=A0AAI8VDP6_9PEZI|nr:Uu.00g101420.m01.CDS01 [Anthostomella pinea]